MGHYYAPISATSNTVVVRRPTVLHGVVGTFPAGAVARIDDAHSFAQGVLNVNAVSSNTVGHFGEAVTGLGIGINSGIVVSATSNARVTVVYE